MTVNSDDETNFSHKLLLTNTQVFLVKVFANNLSVNNKLLKTQLSKRIQYCGFLGNIFVHY